MEYRSSADVPNVAFPKIIFFDVNETLLGLGSMKDPVAEVLGGRKTLLSLWFSRMLHC